MDLRSAAAVRLAEMEGLATCTALCKYEKKIAFSRFRGRSTHGDRNRRSSFRHGLDMAHHEFEIVTDKERIFFKLDPRALQTPSNELALWTRKLQLLARGFDAQVTLLEA